MRLPIAVVSLLTLQTIFYGRVQPFNQLPDAWQMGAGFVLGMWALLEAFLALRKQQRFVEEREASEAQRRLTEKRLAESADQVEGLSLLETERNELRARNTKLSLRERELEESNELLKKKISQLERERSKSVDEQALAQRAVLTFLGSLQDKGRIVDFLMDDITAYSDAQVGAAARVVHQGCASVLKQHLTVSPIYPGSEGGQFTLNPGYSPSEWRLVGAVRGQPPFKGSVLHRGWKVERVDLSRSIAPTSQTSVIAPAELELN